MDMKTHSSRRTFLKTLALSTGAIFAAPFVNLQSTFAALASSKDPLVKALKYFDVEKAEKDAKGTDAVASAEAKAFLKTRTDSIKATKADAKKSFCNACNFYQGDAKSKEAKCTLITSGDVAATGWCSSWSPKLPQKKA